MNISNYTNNNHETNKEEKNMNNNVNEINLETKKAMNTVELKNTLNDQGVQMNVIYVNDKPFVNVGYVSEADKEACIRAVQTAVDNSDSLMEAMMKLQNCCELGHAGIDPDEEVTIEGVDLPVMISYKERKAYIGLDEVANLEDLNLPSVGKEVILALLTDRVKLYWEQKKNEENYCDCDCGCDECDW